MRKNFSFFYTVWQFHNRNFYVKSFLKNWKWFQEIFFIEWVRFSNFIHQNLFHKKSSKSWFDEKFLKSRSLLLTLQIFFLPLSIQFHVISGEIEEISNAFIAQISPFLTPFGIWIGKSEFKNFVKSRENFVKLREPRISA